jgi:hypothetical protein
VTLGDVITLSWGIGPFLLYAVALYRRLESWHKHGDARSKREVVLALALALAAFAAAMSFVSVVMMIGDSSFRRVLAGIAWSAFGAAGVIWIQETPRDD